MIIDVRGWSHCLEGFYIAKYMLRYCFIAIIMALSKSLSHVLELDNLKIEKYLAVAETKI